MAKIILIILVSVAALSAAVYGQKRRYYSVETSDPYAPVEITEHPESVDMQTYMRDPNAHPHESTDKAKRKPIQKKVAQITYVPQKHAFTPLVVEGKLRKPRVKFQQEKIEVGRVDDAMRLDFLNQVFEKTGTENY